MRGRKCASNYAGGSMAERSEMVGKRREDGARNPRARTGEYSEGLEPVKTPHGDGRTGVFPL